MLGRARMINQNAWNPYLSSLHKAMLYRNLTNPSGDATCFA